MNSLHLVQVHPTTLVLPSGEDTPVPKQIVIRNTTRQDIVLKIKSDAPRALQFEAEKIVVDSRKYVIVNMVFNEKELTSSPKVSGSTEMSEVSSGSVDDNATFLW
ncbi:hypothetical protein Y032_0001g31 [Ancylostoma ceylanicum]|uniref:MSP domain-containing protein n=1 Tax=Ancylostoma ceylanicum TaxID=53326 RepID=A0A016W2Z2_9BILA|nr:hypothetical protein Y032_0001g31 [Ancylostoma ceylanicum]